MEAIEVHNKKEIDLSRYEYEILNLLINRPEWVYFRRRIMELIWDEPGMSMDRTVDTYIKTIRIKIKVVKELTENETFLNFTKNS